MTYVEHQCVLCVHLRPNSKPRLYDQAQACDVCRLRLSTIPADIADAWTYLDVEPTRGRPQPRTTRAPAIPLAIDPYDLLANHQPPQGPVGRHRLAANADLQVGHLPIAVTLAGWVDDWAVIRDKGEIRPASHVTTLCAWLTSRTDWACDHHRAVDEYAAELLELRAVLFGLVGRPEPDDRPTVLQGVPCPRCRHCTLTRHRDGDTECQHPDCGTIWRPEEYDRVTKAVVKHAQRTHA